MPSTIAQRLPGAYDLKIPQETNFVLGMRYKAASLPAPPFAASSPYLAGEFVAAGGLTYLVTVAGTAAASPPTWPTATLGQTVVSGTVTFMLVDSSRLIDTAGYYGQIMIRPEVGSPSSYLFCSTANGRLEVGFSPAKFVPGAVYAVGNQVVPSVLNGWLYQCVVAGTAGGTEPAWGLVAGGITTSGGASFRLVMGDAYVSNLRLALIVSDTASLDWATAVYQFDLTDPFGNITAMLYDDARLIQNLIT